MFACNILHNSNKRLLQLSFSSEYSARFESPAPGLTLIAVLALNAEGSMYQVEKTKKPHISSLLPDQGDDAQLRHRARATAGVCRSGKAIGRQPHAGQQCVKHPGQGGVPGFYSQPRILSSSVDHSITAVVSVFEKTRISEITGKLVSGAEFVVKLNSFKNVGPLSAASFELTLK